MMNEFLFMIVGVGIGLFVSEWVLDPRRRSIQAAQIDSALDHEGIRREEFVALEKIVLRDVTDLNAKYNALRDRICSGR